MAEYAAYEFVHDWPELAVAVNQLEVRLRSKGRKIAADMLVEGFAQLQRELLALAKDMAVRATAILQETERDTRVRPDTHGLGGPRLEDSLRADVMPQQNLLPGSIGVANEDVLDATVPWWITNEIGSSARVGGELFGTFYGEDDAGPPDSDQFREHPLFAPGKNDTLSGRGIIENPIPARKFIAKAWPIINREWQQGFHAAKGKFDITMARALATPR